MHHFLYHCWKFTPSQATSYLHGSRLVRSKAGDCTTGYSLLCLSNYGRSKGYVTRLPYSRYF